MNEARKLSLSKETLRCLDDEDLMGVAGGNFSGNCNSALGVCISAQGNCESLGACNSVACHNQSVAVCDSGICKSGICFNR